MNSSTTSRFKFDKITSEFDTSGHLVLLYVTCAYSFCIVFYKVIWLTRNDISTRNIFSRKSLFYLWSAKPSKVNSEVVGSKATKKEN